MHFTALVDSQVGSLAGELDDSVSFLCAMTNNKCPHDQ